MVVLKWYKSDRKDKKYKVEIYKNNKKVKTVHFGHKKYQHYKDQTPLKLYKHKDHLDKKRRDRYRKRHSKILNKEGKPSYKRKYSASWFSYYYLW